MDSATSTAWADARNQLVEEIDRWIAGAIRRQRDLPFAGGHDECNYTASWPRFSLITGDPEPMQFCKRLRNQLLDWPEFYHGFYPDANWDIEHSVENWTIFMRALAEADPGDEVTLDGIEDVVHHLGNWADGVPDWFDWERRRFVSEHVGTRQVRDEPPWDFSTYWDARASELALAYHDLRGEERYLQFAVAFAGGWADHILAQEDLGYWLMLDADLDDREGFREAYGEYPEDFHARNIGWVHEIMRHMLHVYSRVGGEELQEASLKIIELGPAAIESFRGSRPDASGWKRIYQERTGDLRFADEVAAADDGLVEAAREAAQQPLPEVLLLEGTGPYPRRAYAWRDEDGALHDLKGPQPAEMMRACELSGDEALGVRAMELAARQLKLATSTLRDGREHGCNARFIHGAGNGAVKVLEMVMA
ncbi:MAG: hypothetical protein U9R79_10065 [Armatimonadota bacterium]|nr:hypothetical protein [Armatimonadota bacterium]